MYKWEDCITHYKDEVDSFIKNYFSKSQNLLVIAGAGFDPRACIFCENLTKSCAQPNISGFFIREERPNPSKELVSLANSNTDKLKNIINTCSIKSVNIFASDGAVIGGREIIKLLRNINLNNFSDIIVDISSLSLGIYYPLVRYLHDIYGKRYSGNLHIILYNSHNVDSKITSIASDRVELVHGFEGGFYLDESSNFIRLWLPQLIEGKSNILDNIYNHIKPHDVCPVLPFPTLIPQLPDSLIRHYGSYINSVWEIDARNFIYADHEDPLDFYRTILQLSDTRKRVFEEIGGSMIILSPIGTKASAIGALMAAIERDFPVAYIEADNYIMTSDDEKQKSEIVTSSHHIWLCGNIYDESSEN